MASSRAAAASSTCSPPASRSPCASSGSAMRSSRCGRSTRPTSAGPVRSLTRPSCPRASSSSTPISSQRSRSGSAVRPRSSRSRSPPTSRGCRMGTLGDAAEVWGGHLAPATALDHLGDAIWVLDEPDEVSAAAEFLWSQADERRAELERAGELPPRWPAAYPEPRDWKRRLHEARDARADLGVRGRRRAARRQPVRLARAGPAAHADRVARRPRWRGSRKEGARVVLASDQSARLAEILDGVRHRRRAHGPRRRRRSRRAGSSLIDRSLNGGFAGGPGRPRPASPTASSSVPSVSVGRGRSVGSSPATSSSGSSPATSSSISTTACRDITGSCGARPAGRAPRNATSSSCTSPTAAGSGSRSSRSSASPAMPAARTRSSRASAEGSGSAPGRASARPSATSRTSCSSSTRPRADAPGRPFGEDTPWQAEMEAAFPYEETPDQLRAAVEVKADLERATPDGPARRGRRGVRQDRGRASARRSRRSSRACRSRCSSRRPSSPPSTSRRSRSGSRRTRSRSARSAAFVPPREHADTIAGLAAGSVDLVIGTHRLLSKDVRFRDLGLVVVDEEQRFGVAPQGAPEATAHRGPRPDAVRDARSRAR